MAKLVVEPKPFKITIDSGDNRWGTVTYECRNIDISLPSVEVPTRHGIGREFMPGDTLYITASGNVRTVPA